MADLVWRLQLTSGQFETDRIPGIQKKRRHHRCVSSCLV